ncbi:hypothetical protein E2C01_086857 [Portunus trituberculatus]|uniref:Uncharacterized protein n=1 Tax=Portunus trituberculatus TaxID=210409 RepID=A0A5B7JEK8_PORTR|nr:hypothetical protein [Portunus trituberculatus]
MCLSGEAQRRKNGDEVSASRAGREWRVRASFESGEVVVRCYSGWCCEAWWLLGAVCGVN